jgi:integrase
MVRTTKRRGRRVLVIDISYKASDGSPRRYRRDAEVQTVVAAHAEERRRLAALAATGSPLALVDETAALAEARRSPAKGPTFGAVVDAYWQTFAPSHLKASSRYSYRTVLDVHLLPQLAELPLASIDGAAVRALDAELAREGKSRSLRRQIQIVLRSVVCKFAVEAGYLAEPPRMPRLPKKADKIPEVISTEDAVRIIAAALCPEHLLALLLAFHAGLRSSEIRALRVYDVDLRANVLRIRQAQCRGVTDTPKSGNDREVPLTKALRDALERALEGRPRNAIVAVTALGKPWGQSGLREMFLRLAERAGIMGSTMHHLRHGFITALLDRGVGTHIVKELAGHADLATTERYAHAVAKNKHAAIAVLNGIDVRGEGAAFARQPMPLLTEGGDDTPDREEHRALPANRRAA